MSHTPGPWKIIGEVPPNCGYTLDGDRFYHQIIAGPDCATVVASDMGENTARLIAAAPEMKTLLENCVILLRTAATQVSNSSIERTVDGERLSVRGLSDTLKGLAASCDAVISKAEGRT